MVSLTILKWLLMNAELWMSFSFSCLTYRNRFGSRIPRFWVEENSSLIHWFGHMFTLGLKPLPHSRKWISFSSARVWNPISCLLPLFFIHLGSGREENISGEMANKCYHQSSFIASNGHTDFLGMTSPADCTVILFSLLFLSLWILEKVC